MGNIEQLILKILDSSSIDEKIRYRKEVVQLFKNSNTTIDLPIAIQLNLSLRLKDAIDNFIIQDNLTSRETLLEFLPSANSYLLEAS